jgi:hypothetical protein
MGDKSLFDKHIQYWFDLLNNPESRTQATHSKGKSKKTNPKSFLLFQALILCKTKLPKSRSNNNPNN